MKSGKITAAIMSAAIAFTTVPLSVTADVVSGNPARELGDVDNDSKVTASDASLVLAEYAQLSNGDGTFSEETFLYADVDRDDKIAASDASLILIYYAYKSSGGPLGFDEYFESLSQTTTTTTTTTTASTTSTTTTTTTTTTNPPSISTEYKIEDIATNYNAFIVYAGKLNMDLMNGNGRYTNSGSITYGGMESKIALAMLNDGLINDEVLQTLLKNYNIDDFELGAEYLYKWCQTQNMFETDVDFSKYTIDSEIGDYLNALDDAYRNGTAEEYIYDKFFVGNISDKCVKNPAIWALTSSYDETLGLNTADVEVRIMDEYIKELNQTVHGESAE